MLGVRVVWGIERIGRPFATATPGKEEVGLKYRLGGRRAVDQGSDPPGYSGSCDAHATLRASSTTRSRRSGRTDTGCDIHLFASNRRRQRRLRHDDLGRAH